MTGTKDRRNAIRMLPIGVLLVITILIAIGAARLSSSNPDEPDAAAATTGRATDAPMATASASPEPTPLADVSFVDIRSGTVSRLPRSIRSIELAKQFDVSPDGHELAFAGGGRIYLAQIDGDNVREATSTPGAASPDWSPDGERIVYSDGTDLFVLDLSTRAIESIPVRRGGRVWRPTFSPDGSSIMFTMVSKGGPDLWTVPARGGRVELLVRLPMPHTNAAFGAFGPDGRIVYRRTQYDGIDITHMTSSAVWITDVDATEHREIQGPGGWMSQIDPLALWPAWSPDGSKIAYEPLFSRGVLVVDVDTGSLTKIGEGTRPTWVDDHTLIIEGYRPGPK